MRPIGWLCLTLALSGCSLWGRHPDSGYSSNKEVSPIIESDKPIVQDTVRLKHLENSLRSSKEIEQYSKALPYFSSKEERIQFLELKDFETRQSWLRSSNFSMRPQSQMNSLKELIDAQDIAIGMPLPLVKRSWGDPESVEVSGHPAFHNAKWKYSRYVSTPFGYKLEKKFVFFEGGKVVGWETE